QGVPTHAPCASRRTTAPVCRDLSLRGHGCRPRRSAITEGEMRARTLMTGNPVVVTGEEPVSRAAQLMRDRNVGIIPVVDDRAHMHLRGVLTDRDIVVRCAAERHPGGCRVEDHMTTGHLVTVPADAEVSEVMSAMER